MYNRPKTQNIRRKLRSKVDEQAARSYLDGSFHWPNDQTVTRCSVEIAADGTQKREWHQHKREVTESERRRNIAGYYYPDEGKKRLRRYRRICRGDRQTPWDPSWSRWNKARKLEIARSENEIREFLADECNLSDSLTVF